MVNKGGGMVLNINKNHLRFVSIADYSLSSAYKPNRRILKLSFIGDKIFDEETRQYQIGIDPLDAKAISEDSVLLFPDGIITLGQKGVSFGGRIGRNGQPDNIIIQLECSLDDIESVVNADGIAESLTEGFRVMTSGNSMVQTTYFVKQ